KAHGGTTAAPAVGRTVGCQSKRDQHRQSAAQLTTVAATQHPSRRVDEGSTRPTARSRFSQARRGTQCCPQAV
ncbi:hypothetical protein ABTB00_18730, partial [Acinetobacter baumannii]